MVSLEQQIRRELISESLEVYPINQYGAVETGEHIFYLVLDDQTSKPISKAKFTSIWRFDNEEWKLARTISYYHIPYGRVQPTEEVLKSYEGNYLAVDRIVQVKKEGAILIMTDWVNNEVVWSAELLAETDHTFYLNQNNVQFKFLKGKGGVQKIIVFENGMQIEELTKEE